MNKNELDYDKEALKSPFSRLYLYPETEQIINCALGLTDPIEVQVLKSAFSNSVMIKHPRFCSLMVRDINGREHWKKTHVNIDDHFIIHDTESRHEDGGEAAVNAFLADIAVSTPMREDKPLWEVHVIMEHNCLVLRVHHSLGDGASLMSMLSGCFGDEHNNKVNAKKNTDGTDERKKWKKNGLWGLIKTLWFTLIFGLRLLGRLMWIKDDKNVIYGGEGVELWPRKLVTAKFKLEDFKSVKKAIPNATINDVLLGIISSGLSKYLDITSPKAMLQGLQLTGIVMVNLRKNPGVQLQGMPDPLRVETGSCSWGNKTGLVLQPVPCCKELHPLDHVRAMKTIMDRKKQSFEAQITHLTLQLLTSLFGPKAARWCCYKMLCNTTMLISNIMGPREQIAIAGNVVTYMRVNISSQPQAITMHMVSYAGKAELQVMVAKDIIRDSDLLAKCLKESLLEMKNYSQIENFNELL